MVTKYDKRQNMVSSYKYKAGNVVKLNFPPKCLKFLVDEFWHVFEGSCGGLVWVVDNL